MTTYGTEIVKRLDAISAIVGALEIPNRLPTMQLDVLTRLDAIIAAILNGGGGTTPPPPVISPVKTLNLTVDQLTNINLDTTNGYFYKITANCPGVIFPVNLFGFDFTYSREIHVAIDNVGANPVSVFLWANSVFNVVYMDFDKVNIPAGKSLEISFLYLDDNTVRITTKLQS